MRAHLHRIPRRAAVLAAAALVLTACSASHNPSHGAASSHASAKPRNGGVATVAEGAQGIPNYIFPFLTPALDSNANIFGLNDQMYVPLYWFGGNGYPISAINPTKSIGMPPVYSDGGRTVTVTLRNYRWSDGQPVTSRDVVFFVNLAKANKATWADYVPGHFPDNVVSYAADGPHKVVFHLTRAYSHTWFTDNDLADITPLPQHVWDKTSASGKVGNYDTTTAGARAVYNFLNGQAKQINTYDSNPLWKVVDGPWKLKSFQSTGLAVFLPNKHYSGPDKPHLSEFREVPFTSDAAEFNALASGHTLSVGYLPTADLPARGRIASLGYNLVRSTLFQINFIVPNFNNRVVGPLLKQLYIRQVLQRTMDEEGQIHTILRGVGGYPVYGPIPPKPATSYLSNAQLRAPYPFSISAARSLLTTHGWQIPSHGAARCVRPGTGPNDCGAGIPAGKTLTFNLLYASGSSYLQQEMETYKSDTGQAGVVLRLTSEPFNTVVSEIAPCKTSQSTCGWQLGNWGAGFAWSFPSAYPSGEMLFTSGSPSNYASYSSPEADRLIAATLSAQTPTTAMQRYDAYLARELPMIWQIATYTLNEVQSGLHGVEFNAIGYINSQDWYFTK